MSEAADACSESKQPCPGRARCPLWALIVEGIDPSTSDTGSTLCRMCRNITTLRGLDPGATAEEIEAAARQYVRKISGVQKTSVNTEVAFEHAVSVITAATTQLLAELPPRQQPPPTLPPLRRINARSTVSKGTPVR